MSCLCFGKKSVSEPKAKAVPKTVQRPAETPLKQATPKATPNANGGVNLLGLCFRSLLKVKFSATNPGPVAATEKSLPQNPPANNVLIKIVVD